MPSMKMNKDEEKIRKMRVLSLNTIDACNVDCVYCSTKERRSGPQRAGRMSPALRKKIIDAAKEAGYRCICLTGPGEPLLDPDFRKTVAMISGKGLIPMVTTNGKLIDRNMASFLGEHGCRVMLKLNSLDMDIDDSLMGLKKRHAPYPCGGWRHADGLEIPGSLANLIDAGMMGNDPRTGLPRITIQTVLTDRNADSIAGIYRMCRSCGFRFHLEELACEGMLDPALRLKGMKRFITHLKLLSAMGLRYLHWKSRISCNLGIEPTVDTDGTMLGCYTRGIAVGRIDEDSEDVLGSLRKGMRACEHFKNKDALNPLWRPLLIGKTCPARRR
jgi:MoaA/NifB/PqqE/SkfB family radical SAM enzyme